MKSPNQYQWGHGLLQSGNFGQMKHVIKKENNLKSKACSSLLWRKSQQRALTPDLAILEAWPQSCVLSQAGWDVRQRQQGRQVWGFWHFQVTAYSEIQVAGTVTPEWIRQTKAAASLKGSRQGQIFQAGGSFGSPAAHTLRGKGCITSKEESTEVVVWYGDLGENRLHCAVQQETSALHSSPQVLQQIHQWPCSYCSPQTLKSPLALGLVLVSPTRISS